MKTKRIRWIDIAKGIGIICIVIGHILRGTGTMIQWIYSFNVPFFFILAGLTFNKEKSLLDVIKTKAYQLLIPYAFFSLISISVFAILGGRMSSVSTDGFVTDEVLPNLLGAIYANSRTGLMKWNTPLWFLPCLFVVEVFAALIEKNLNHICRGGKKKTILRIVIAFSSATIGFGLFGRFLLDVVLPFHVEAAIILLLYFELGILVRDNMKIGYVIECISKKARYIICILLFVLGFSLVKMNWLADIRLMKFGNNEILYLLASIVNSSALIALSIVIGKFTVLEYIGRNTMKVLVMHKFPVLFFQALVPITSKIIIHKSDTVVGCFMAIIIAILSTYMCIVAGNITEKMVPWLYGKRGG